MQDIMRYSRYISPVLKKYEDFAVLTSSDVREILRIGENNIYRFLEVAPFRAEKIGGRWFIFAPSFWEWYFGERSNVA